MLNPDQRKELSSLYRLLYASAIGLTAGMTATMFYSLGAFIPPLQEEFGWSRGDISLGATFLTLALFISGSTAGRLCDRYGAAKTGAISLLVYGFGVMVLASSMSRLEHFWVGYFLIAVLGAGSTPIVLVRPITTEFLAARGVALGVALTGAGIAGFWVPRLVAHVTTIYGWREAYFSLAVVAVLAAPVVWFGFRSVSSGQIKRDSDSHREPGVSHQQARRMSSYWLLSLMAFTMAAGIAGIIVHLVPLFVDSGADPLQAARVASIVGIASVAGRLAIGYLLDRLMAKLVAVAVLLLASQGVFLLWQMGAGMQYLAVVLLGLAAGAEIDLLAYLTVSYFGRDHYGAIYGWQYSIFALGYGISPYWVGKLHDFSGGYDAPLIGSGILMLIAAGCCFWLPDDGRKALPA